MMASNCHLGIPPSLLLLFEVCQERERKKYPNESEKICPDDLFGQSIDDKPKLHVLDMINKNTGEERTICPFLLLRPEHSEPDKYGIDSRRKSSMQFT